MVREKRKGEERDAEVWSRNKVQISAEFMSEARPA
jgi:hypothetical protein